MARSLPATGSHPARTIRLIRREAIEQTRAAGAAQRLLAAAAARAARQVGGVPGLRRVVVAKPDPVVVADHRGPLGAARPIAAGHVVRARERAAVALRAGEDVVHVRRVAAALDRLALLGESGFLRDLVAGAVEVVEVAGYDFALGVAPGPAADAVARADSAWSL